MDYPLTLVPFRHFSNLKRSLANLVPEETLLDRCRRHGTRALSSEPAAKRLPRAAAQDHTVLGLLDKFQSEKHLATTRRCLELGSDQSWQGHTETL